MKYALISTFEPEQPYSFKQVCDEKMLGDFNGIIWIELPDDVDIDPTTHIYTENGFELKPEREPKTIITSVENQITVI
jgi:hypothetical protein